MKKSPVSMAAIRVIKQAQRGILSASQANERLLALIPRTVGDFWTINAARDAVRKLTRYREL